MNLQIMVVEVLGSFASNAFAQENLHENTQSWGMLPVCALIEILHEFQL